MTPPVLNSRDAHDWIKKLWGGCRRIYDGVVRVDFAYGLRGGASSRHRHPGSDNHFHCLSGVVDLYVGADHFWRRLVKGDSAIVPAGTWHRMTFPADAELVELYTQVDLNAAILHGLIERFDTGWAPGDAPAGWPPREDQKKG